MAKMISYGEEARRALVKGVDRRAHPVRLLRIIAELIRVTERRVLCRDLTPHIPAAAFFDLLVERRRLILTTDC